jgi:hypothetical protein
MTAKTAPKPAETSPTQGLVDEEGVSYQSLRVGDLEIDKRIQRDAIRESTLDRIRKTYNRRALNTLAVSQRANGKLFLVDGQHRKIVVTEKEPDGKDALVPCKVYTGLNLQEEAKLFVELNNQEAANPLDKHKARVVQKDPVSLALRDAAQAYNWEIGSGNKRISAVRVLEDLYYAGESAFDNASYGPVLVENTIGVITGAWGNGDAKAMGQSILKAVGGLALDVEIWVAKEGKPDDFFDYDAGPAGWVSAMKGQSQAAGKSLSLQGAMRRSLFDTYNKKQRKTSRKLPEELAKPQRHAVRAPGVEPGTPPV